jgi:hypothetical protein
MWKIFSVPCGSALYKFHCIYIFYSTKQAFFKLFGKLDLEDDESKAHKSEGKNFHIGGFGSLIEPPEKCI